MAKGKLACILCVLSLLCVVQVAAASADTPTEVFGADANPTGDPLGGGVGYSRIVLSGEYTVSTKSELLTALTKAKAGETIYIEPQAEIDLTGMINIAVPAGVTVAGNRGYQGSLGPLIFTNNTETFPSLFLIYNKGVRFTGIRLRGPGASNTVGLNFRANDAEVDNCEISYWSNTGVNVMNATNAYIHHNSFHHLLGGLGYGICLNKATALIEANIFEYFRHAIAGAGFAGTGYEARYNMVKGNATSHAFDMHGGTDFCAHQSTPCTEQDYIIAGDYVSIHHNTFEITPYGSVIIRGVPRQYMEVHHNVFKATHADAFTFKNFNGGNSHVYQNIYGADKRLISTQVEPSPFIYKIGVTNAYALADARLIKYGFANPLPGTMSTIKGDLKVELLPVEVFSYPTQPADVKPFVISGVEIKLNSTLIYAAERMPNSGEVVVDTSKLTNGVYRLSFKINSNVGKALEQSVTIRVAN